MKYRVGFPADRVWFAAAGLTLLCALAACAGAAREEVNSLSELRDGETVVVGRIELVPPLRKDEQRITGLGTSGYENKIFLLTDEHDGAPVKEPAMADFTGRIEAILGKDFFVRSRKSFLILGGVLFLDISGSDMNRAYFPGGFTVSIAPGDKAVYIGTVRYHRNELFQTTNVTIDDDYDRASGEFAKKFGPKVSLRKALLTQAQ
jgi:hypothetical protein